jgi:hypothetical protein
MLDQRQGQDRKEISNGHPSVPTDGMEIWIGSGLGSLGFSGSNAFTVAALRILQKQRSVRSDRFPCTSTRSERCGPEELEAPTKLLYLYPRRPWRAQSAHLATATRRARICYWPTCGSGGRVTTAEAAGCATVRTRRWARSSSSALPPSVSFHMIRSTALGLLRGPGLVTGPTTQVGAASQLVTEKVHYGVEPDASRCSA